MFVCNVFYNMNHNTLGHCGYSYCGHSFIVSTHFVQQTKWYCLCTWIAVKSMRSIRWRKTRVGFDRSAILFFQCSISLATNEYEKMWMSQWNRYLFSASSDFHISSPYQRPIKNIHAYLWYCRIVNAIASSASSTFRQLILRTSFEYLNIGSDCGSGQCDRRDSINVKQRT